MGQSLAGAIAGTTGTEGLGAAAENLAAVLTTTRPGELAYDFTSAKHTAIYAQTNGLIPDRPPPPTSPPAPVAQPPAPVPEPFLTIRPSDAELAEIGRLKASPADAPTIAAGLVTLAETVAPAVLERVLPALLGGLGLGVLALVTVELLKHLAAKPAVE